MGRGWDCVVHPSKEHPFGLMGSERLADEHEARLIRSFMRVFKPLLSVRTWWRPGTELKVTDVALETDEEINSGVQLGMSLRGHGRGWPRASAYWLDRRYLFHPNHDLSDRQAIAAVSGTLGVDALDAWARMEKADLLGTGGGNRDRPFSKVFARELGRYARDRKGDVLTVQDVTLVADDDVVRLALVARDRLGDPRLFWSSEDVFDCFGVGPERFLDYTSHMENWAANFRMAYAEFRAHLFRVVPEFEIADALRAGLADESQGRPPAFAQALVNLEHAQWRSFAAGKARRWTRAVYVKGPLAAAEEDRAEALGLHVFRGYAEMDGEGPLCIGDVTTRGSDKPSKKLQPATK